MFVLRGGRFVDVVLGVQCGFKLGGAHIQKMEMQDLIIRMIVVRVCVCVVVLVIV